jgi:tetratricopeptide (TPR) repeat protein
MNNLSQIFKNEVKKIMNYFNVGQYDIVIKKSKILLKKNPEYIGLYNMIGISHQKEKRYEEAINIFLQGLRVDPVNYTLILNLANSYKAQMKYDLAEINYKKILTHNPTYVLALLNYGNLKNDLNQGDEAIELYDRALKIDDKNFKLFSYYN